MTKAGQVLITGADGYLGRLVAEKFLREKKSEVVLVVRASNDIELQAKRQKMTEYLKGFEGQYRIVQGDLRSEQMFSDIDPLNVTKICHTAAITRFNVEEDTATVVNNRGSELVYRWALKCPKLESFAYTSTLYSTGLHEGVIDERAFDSSAGFGNFYEQSKWNAETKLIEKYEGLPWQVYRVATIMCDDASGRVTQYNAFHNTMKLLYYGLVSLMPGDRETTLYFVTGDWVASGIFELMNKPYRHRIYNVAPAYEDALNLGQLIDITYQVFEESSDFKLRRILKPLFTDLKSFELLSQGVQGLGGDILNQALSSVTPFAKQLFLKKQVRNEKFVADLSQQTRLPQMQDLVRSTVKYLVASRWGRLDPSEESRSSGGAHAQ